MLSGSEEFTMMPLYWQVASLLRYWCSGESAQIPASSQEQDIINMV